MNLLPGSKRITTADAQIGSGTKQVRLFSVSLLSGASASTLTLRNGADTSGTIWEQVDGFASQSVTKNYNGGLLFPMTSATVGGLFADVDANITSAVFVFTEEL